jgi:hypothetical protein
MSFFDFLDSLKGRAAPVWDDIWNAPSVGEGIGRVAKHAVDGYSQLLPLAWEGAKGFAGDVADGYGGRGPVATPDFMPPGMPPMIDNSALFNTDPTGGFRPEWTNRLSEIQKVPEPEPEPEPVLPQAAPPVSPGMVGDPALGPLSQPQPLTKPNDWDPFDSPLIAGGDFWKGGPAYSGGVQDRTIDTAKDFFSRQAPEGEPMGRQNDAGVAKGSARDQWVADTYARALKIYNDPEEARLATAQAALETGWGKSVPGGNLFGIKGGKGPALKTKEVRDGKWVTENASFREYDSPDASIEGRMEFLKKNPRYTKAGYFDAQTAEEKAEALQRAGYATDPQYAAKLSSIAGKVGQIVGQQSPESPQLQQASFETPQAAPALPQARADYSPQPLLPGSSRLRNMARGGGDLAGLAQLIGGYGPDGLTLEEQLLLSRKKADQGKWAKLNDGTLYHDTTGETRGVGGSGPGGLAGMTPKARQELEQQLAELPAAIGQVEHVRNTVQEAMDKGVLGPIRGSGAGRLVDRYAAAHSKEADERTRIRQNMDSIGVEATLEALGKIGGSDTEREFQWLREVELNSNMTDGEARAWLAKYDRNMEKSLANLRAKGILTPELEAQIRTSVGAPPSSAAEKQADSYIQ